MRRHVPLVALVVGVVALSGCVAYSASRIPESFLDAQAGNGWVLDRMDPADGPREEQLGLVKSRSAFYRDPGGASGSEGGYPASLTVVSLKVAFQQPDRAEVESQARQQVEKAADRLGVTLEKPPTTRERTAASGDRAAAFLYDGTAEDDSSLFAREADVKVAGMVWNCQGGGGNTIVTVGLAQVNERTQGVLDDPNDRSWVELWQDADRSDRGSDGGLMIQATCG